MFTQSLLFSLLLLILFLFSRRIINIIYKLVFIVTLNHKISLYLLAFIILPGTIIHELSHFLIATILRVPTGTLSVFPTIEENGETRAGKLTLGKVDPFRQTLVGLAPMIVGLPFIYIAGKYFFPGFLLSTINHQPSIILLLFLKCYLLFAVSITMFSSRKDLESLIIVGPLSFLVLSSLYIIGIRISLAEMLVNKMDIFLSNLNFYLLTAVLINGIICLILHFQLLFWEKISGRKIAKKI